MPNAAQCPRLFHYLFIECIASLHVKRQAVGKEDLIIKSGENYEVMMFWIVTLQVGLSAC